MRPSDSILKGFYDLADYDSSRRMDAIARLLTEIKSDPSTHEYCVERLITGLSSMRGAVRLGYASALCMILMESRNLWTLDRLIAIANKKLDLRDKDNEKANAIAHHLLVSAISRSNAFSEVDVTLLKHELEVYRVCPSLGMSIAQLMAEIVGKMDRKTFKSQVVPLIKDYLSTAVTQSSVEFLYLVLLLKDHFPSCIAEIASFVQKDGSCRFSQSDFTFLFLTLRKCDPSTLEPFLKLLLETSRRSGQFSDIYKNVIEKWCTSGDDSNILERILDTARLTLSTSETAHKEILTVFTPFMVDKIKQVLRKQGAQQKVLRGKITDFCKFAESIITPVEDDGVLLKVIEVLDTSDNFDSLTGANFVNHLVGRLTVDGVRKWMQTANKAWSLRHICSAFSQWNNDAKLETILALLHRPRSDELQYTIGSCVNSLFKMKVRAGEWVRVSLIDGGEEILRHLVKAICGKHNVKSVMKILCGSTFYKSTLPMLWMCLNIWSKACSSDQLSNEYLENAEELLVIAKDGEDSMKVLLDLIFGLLSQPLRYHRTAAYYVFVQLLGCVNEEHIAHIIETLMMSDEEIVDEQGSDESSTDSDGNVSNTDESLDEDIDSECPSENEEMDTGTFDRFESALGKAAVKRKSNAPDEEETDGSMSDTEMFELDDRLVAAFRSIAPMKEKKWTSPLASAFRLRLADLLLFVISSSCTPSCVKIHMLIPLFKLAKVQLKQNAESQISKKTLSLINILLRLKKIYLVDKEVVSLLDQLVQEAIGISNPILVSTAAAISSFIFTLGVSSDGVCSEIVLSAFVALFERFMIQDDGLIGSDLAIAAVIKHPEAFVSKSKVFLTAGFSDDFRIFRKTEALLCLSAIMNKNVLRKVPVEKAIVKSIAKLSSTYISASLSYPDTIKPRYFASVLKLLASLSNGISNDCKSTLKKHLKLEFITEDGKGWDEVSKKINPACQQLCGRTATHVLRNIQKPLL